MVKEWRDALVHLFYPSLCFGCNNDILQSEQFLCLDCHASLGHTQFEIIRKNPVEKRYWGRVDLSFASSTFFYLHKTPIQEIIHHIKYRNAAELGRYMGEIQGIRAMTLLKDFETELLIPMPLHPKKEYRRGYNQATLLCEGIKKTTGIHYNEKVLVRNEDTKTQTKKSRIERWNNVSSVFEIADHQSIENKHVVLVDDVITTGASTEACATVLLQHGAKTVGLCSLAFTL